MTTVDLLKELVKIPSYVGSGCNEAKIGIYIKSLFKNSRYKVEEQGVVGNRKNLYVHDNLSPKIILLAHMDTVPPKKETKNSFVPQIEGEKLFGLGSVDMKSGLAVAINALLANKKPGLAAIFSVDEEYEDIGASKFVSKYNLKPNLIINLEPTDLEILNGCRGILEFTFDVNGKAAHAGMKYLGINAIEKAMEFVDALEREFPKSSVNLAYIHGGNLESQDKNGHVKLSQVGNIVPNYAHLQVEIRTVEPGINFKSVQNFLEKLARKQKIKLSNFILKSEVGSMYVSPDKLKSFEKAVREAKIPVKYREINKSGYYEAQIFQAEWSCPVAIFGPGPNNISHCVDEYVDLKTVVKTEEVIAKYLEYNL